MAERTMEELLRAPTEGYEETIVLPKINADHFEIKMNLLQLVQANPFYGRESENPHAQINSFKRITSTLRLRNVPNDVIKLMMFPYSLEGAAKTWYEKEPPNSILTWEDLVTKFVNQFFPPSKTTHLKNEISRFTQKFEETFSEAWERFKELLRACPHHGFTELTQVDTFYNGLNENEQDSLNAAAGGNLLSKTTREALNIIENKSKVRYSRNRSNASRMNATSSKTDERIDKLADQLSTLVEIVSKKVITPAPGPHTTFQLSRIEPDLYNSQFFQFLTINNPRSSFVQLSSSSRRTNYKEILQAREDLMKAIQALLKEYDHIPLNEKCLALLLAEERFLKIKQTMKEEQNQPEVMQELLLKLMDDLQILKRSQHEKKVTETQSFIPFWNLSMIDDEEARDNFLKDICTFLRKFSHIPFGVTPKVILIAWEKFDVRNIREELSEYINCPSWNRPTFYDNDDDEYTIIYSKPKASTPDLPIEEPGNSLSIGDEHLSTILKTDSDELIKSSVENLVPIPSEFKGISEDMCDVPVYEDPSKFDALSDHSEILSDSNDDGTSSDDDSYENIEYVSLEEVNKDQEKKEFDLEDIFQIQDIEPDQEGLISIVISDNSNDPLLELPEFESFHFDPSSPRPPPEPPDVEISLTFEPDALVINNFDELNEDECFDPGGGEIDVEDDDSFTFVIRTFLPFLTYPEVSPLLSSIKNEDTIFNPDIST
ncbi:reverse transcriptase domain-containing protein [Tanacetum coccineum]